MSAAWELQKAIYAALNNATSAGADVYSLGDVPEGFTGLYVVIGDSTLVEHDTDGTTGFNVTVRVDTWDSDPGTRGFNRLKPLMGEIYDILHRGTISVVGYTVVDIFQESEQPFQDPDGITMRGVQRLRAILTKQ